MAFRFKNFCPTLQHILPLLLGQKRGNFKIRDLNLFDSLPLNAIVEESLLSSLL